MSEFDFDWTGEDPAFLVTNEIQEIGPVLASEFNIIIPDFAPFFYESLTVQYFDASVWVTLVKDVDYTPGHLFVQATRQTTKAIYGSYVLTDKTRSGAIRHTYQKLGGAWSADIGQIAAVLSDKIINPRRTTWEQVADIPEQFPTISHVHIDEEDVTGLSEVNDSINRLIDTMEMYLAGGLEATIDAAIAVSMGEYLTINLSTTITELIETHLDTTLAPSIEAYLTDNLTTNIEAYLETRLQETVSVLSIVSGVVTIDCSLGSLFTLTLTENVTSILFTNIPPAGKGKSIWIVVKQDGTGLKTIALPSSFKATDGSDSIPSDPANSYTVIAATTVDEGVRWEYTMQGVAS